MEKKEYPATHSMCTAWYAIDNEGNVAIIDFEDNGPVPVDTPETDLCEIVMNFMAEDEKKFTYVKSYTKEQVEQMFAQSEAVNSLDKLLESEAIYQIDTAKEELFREILIQEFEEYDRCYCLSQELGIYFLDDLFFLKDESKERLIREKIILRQCRWYDNIEDAWNEEENKYDFNHHGNIPFYIYSQPYDINDLIKRIHAPIVSVREEQLPIPMRKKAYRLPFSFRQTDKFQIAEFLYSTMWGDNPNLLYRDRRYQLLPISNGEKAYILLSAMPMIRCGMGAYHLVDKEGKVMNGCEGCRENNNDDSLWSRCLTEEYTGSTHPTILVIRDIYGRSRFDSPINNLPKDKLASLCILQGIPAHGEGNYMDGGEIKEHYPTEKLCQYFKKCKVHLEKLLEEIIPYVLIVENQAYEILKSQYSIEDRLIKINGKTYPLYLEYEVNAHFEEIMSLGNKPYHGIEIPKIIYPDKIPEGATFVKYLIK